jgi:hypothetical protein
MAKKMAWRKLINRVSGSRVEPTPASPIRSLILSGTHRLYAQMIEHLVGQAVDILGQQRSAKLIFLRDGVKSLPSKISPSDIERLKLQQEIYSSDLSDVVVAISKEFYTEIVSLLGDVRTGRIYEQAYKRLSETCGKEKEFPLLLRLIPDELLDEEKIRVLDKEQIKDLLLDRLKILQSANLLLNRSSTRLDRHLKALLRVNTASASTLDGEAQIRAALDEVIQILGAERALLFLVPDKSNQLKLKVGRATGGKELVGQTDFNQAVVDQVHGEKRAATISRENPDQQCGIIAAPIMVQDRFIGIVYLDHSKPAPFSQEDVGILQAVTNHIGIAIQTTQLVQSEILRRELTKDLEIARGVQAYLMPDSNEFNYSKVEAFVHYESAAQVAGDWWWCAEHSEGRVLAIIGDVTGHGAGPALVSAAVVGAYRTIEHEQDMNKILSVLNQSTRKVCRGEYWMAMAVVEINPLTSQLTWWCMGSPPMPCFA